MILLALLACAPTPESFAEDFEAGWCEYIIACDSSHQFSGYEDCRRLLTEDEQISETMETFPDLWDPEAAAECLDAMDRAIEECNKGPMLGTGNEPCNFAFP